MSKLEVGDKVWLGNPANLKVRVGSGRVSSIGGNGQFHHRLIPTQYVRVNLESVEVNTALMVPVEEADQVNLVDAMGSSVLWSRELTFRKC